MANKINGKVLWVAIAIAILFLISCVRTGPDIEKPLPYNPEPKEGISIANWNLQILGDSKASKPELMNFYSTKISQYDIIFVQEIRDTDTSAFYDLCALLPQYNCQASSRAGRTSSKEQYGVISKKGIVVTDIKDYNPDSDDRWERPPIRVTFDLGAYNLTVFNIHTKPDDVQAEMAALTEIVKDEGNVMLLGDLNADCDYYSNIKEKEFDDWYWLIGDEYDTTVAQTDCAYDRIIVSPALYPRVLVKGVDATDITKEISDHYLVWVILKGKD